MGTTSIIVDWPMWPLICPQYSNLHNRQVDHSGIKWCRINAWCRGCCLFFSFPVSSIIFPLSRLFSHSFSIQRQYYNIEKNSYNNNYSMRMRWRGVKTRSAEGVHTGQWENAIAQNSRGNDTPEINFPLRLYFLPGSCTFRKFTRGNWIISLHRTN